MLRCDQDIIDHFNTDEHRERLSRNVQQEFPDIQGFSPRNIWRMRTFYLAYTEEVRNLPQPAAVLSGLSPSTEICQTVSGKFTLDAL